MDAEYEKRAIRKQNGKWIDRKKAKPNIKKANHPWYWTDGQSAQRIQNPGYFETNLPITDKKDD
jgi:hypothetical protein